MVSLLYLDIMAMAGRVACLIDLPDCSSLSADHEVESAKSFEEPFAPLTFTYLNFIRSRKTMNGGERIYGSVPRS